MTSLFTLPNSPTCILPLLSAPSNCPPSEPGHLWQLDGVAITWPQNRTLGYFKPVAPLPIPQQRHLHQVACTCPISCANSKPTNPDGSPRKKRNVCHYPNCTKSYSRTTHLHSHFCLHTGERPFVCHWLYCGKVFTRLNGLQRHLRIHMGDKRIALSAESISCAATT